MTHKIDFFTPVNFGDMPRSWMHRFFDACDTYVSWGTHELVVIRINDITNIYEGELKTLPQKKYNLWSIALTIVTIFSYIPFGLPALLIKGIARYNHCFEITKPTTANGIDPKDPARQELQTRREETKKIVCPIARKTGMATTDACYMNPSGKILFLRTGEQLLKESCAIPNSILNDPIQARYADQKIIIVNRDCLEAARDELKNEAKKVAVLMFASPLEPGGAMEEGNNGQEEDLCRRSDIFGFMWDQAHFTASSSLYNLVDLSRPHQTDPDYNSMRNNKMIHVPNVTVFRSGKNDHYSMLEEPFEVGMLISPALDRPRYRVTHDEINYVRKEDEEQLNKVITTQLKGSYEENYDTIILGAFGCGAFQNPPELVARIYKKIIDERFSGAFKKIVFAILDDGHSGTHNPEGNLKPFQKCFN